MGELQRPKACDRSDSEGNGMQRCLLLFFADRLRWPVLLFF